MVRLARRPCEECSRLFKPRRKDALYCAPACRTAAYRERLRAAPAPMLCPGSTATSRHYVVADGRVCPVCLQSGANRVSVGRGGGGS